MIHLMKLEIEKSKLGKHVIISGILILFSILFITISLIDSATDLTQSKDTFDNTFKMIGVLLSVIYIIFYGVLVSSLIIKEYNTRTILIMFSYPVERKKLIGAKLLIISSFIALSLAAGYLLCSLYIIGADHFFNLLSGSFKDSYLISWPLETLTTIIICVCIGLLTFVIGMINKSVSFTIVCSIVFVFIRQVFITSSLGYSESLVQTLMVAAVTIALLYYSLSFKINQIE